MIDLTRVPFSRFGSYFVFSRTKEKGKDLLFLRDIHGGDLDWGSLFSLHFLNEKKEPAALEDMTLRCSETLLRLEAPGGGFLEVLFPDEEGVRFYAQGLSLELRWVIQRYDTIVPYLDLGYEVASYSRERKYLIRPHKGELTVKAPWEGVGHEFLQLFFSGETVDFSLDSYKAVPPLDKKDPPPFPRDKENLEALYQDWYQKAPVLPSDYQKEKDLAVYLTWANGVRPEGHLDRYALYMSKNGMTNIWSWDNCFSAMYLGERHPRLAWDQLMIFASLQDESGMYPDFANDSYYSFSCAKPPVHGWCYGYLMEKNDFFKNPRRLAPFYHTLVKSTRFWLNYRRSPQGLIFCTHGNESGWDNSTVFRQGVPVISPDVNAYLVLQLEFLAQAAGMLGKGEEEREWAALAGELTALLVQELWTGRDFEPRLLETGLPLTQGDSLQRLMPLVLGPRLGEEVFQVLLASLRDPERFFAPFGLATEALNSPFYKKNGYWRGPVWAPIMMLLIDALRRGGEEALGKTLALRFCLGVKKGGMAENMDPLTGEGLVDPAFTWTSCVFLILADTYLS